MFLSSRSFAVRTSFLLTGPGAAPLGVLLRSCRATGVGPLPDPLDLLQDLIVPELR